MRLTKIKLKNYRCFGENEQMINVDNLTLFIGNNSTGKTAVLSALKCMFSEYANDRVLSRRDFHTPKDKRPDEIDQLELYIEAIFEFDGLEADDKINENSIPVFFKSMVVDGVGKDPILRIRLEGLWEKSNTIDGEIDSNIYFITCSENEDCNEHKHLASRRDLSKIRFIYIPALRDTAKQLHNTAGTFMHRMMHNIKWHEETKEKIKESIQKLNEEFFSEKGVSLIKDTVASQWNYYDSDERYSKAVLQINSTNMDSALKNSEIVFSPTEIDNEFTIDQMGDGLRSLFYISLMSSLLNMEARMSSDEEWDNSLSPVLNIIGLEEPENHIAPHLLGSLMNKLKEIWGNLNSQVIITSHSPAIVKRVAPENLRYFRMDKDSYESNVRSLSLPDTETYAAQYKYVKEAICAYPELYFSKLVILGEGDSEEIILPVFLKIMGNELDDMGISVVPLGGRHVNHFWRLLNDLQIPHITLLDFDQERSGGDWGRISYIISQLKQYIDPLKYNELISSLSEEGINVDNIAEYKVTKEDPSVVIDELKKYNIFYSYPLDIDFLMLEYYGDHYKKISSSKQGPYIVDRNGVRKYIKDIEKKAMLKTDKEIYDKRIVGAVRATLKMNGGNGDTYTENQKKLMIWYEYFFLNRGKPATHIEALSQMTKEELNEYMPTVISELIERANSMLRGVYDEDIISQ